MKKQFLCLAMLAGLTLAGCGPQVPTNTSWPSFYFEERGWTVPEWTLAEGESLTYEVTPATATNPEAMVVDIKSRDSERLQNYLSALRSVSAVDVSTYYWQMYRSYGRYGGPIYMNDFYETYQVAAQEKATNAGEFDGGYTIAVYALAQTYSEFLTEFPSDKIAEDLGEAFSIVPSFAIPEGASYRYYFASNYVELAALDAGTIGTDSIEDVLYAQLSADNRWSVDDSKYLTDGYIAVDASETVKLSFYTENGMFKMYVEEYVYPFSQFVDELIPFMSDKGYNISGGEYYDDDYGYLKEWQVAASETVTETSIVEGLFNALTQHDLNDPDYETEPTDEYYAEKGIYASVWLDYFFIEVYAKVDAEDSTKINVTFDAYDNRY